MSIKIRAISYLMVAIITVLATLLTVKSCERPPTTTHTEHTIIDSVAVQVLRGEIEKLKKAVDAQPKIITTVRIIEGATITDTVVVYPVGDIDKKRSYGFTAKADKDSVSLKVNTELYASIYAVEDGSDFYYEDSLRVWLSDINIYSHKPATPPAPNSFFYILAGMGAQQYEQNVGGAAIKQTDVRPELGVGYVRDWIGGYVLFNTGGGRAGIMINPMTALSKLKDK